MRRTWFVLVLVGCATTSRPGDRVVVKQDTQEQRECYRAAIAWQSTCEQQCELSTLQGGGSSSISEIKMS